MLRQLRCIYLWELPLIHLVMCILLICTIIAFGRLPFQLLVLQGTFIFIITAVRTYLLVVSSVTPSIAPTVLTNYPSVSPSAVFIITTITGSSTSGSFSGDGSAATSATFNSPIGVAVDSSGNNITILLIMLGVFTLFPSQATYTSLIRIIIVSAR